MIIGAAHGIYPHKSVVAKAQRWECHDVGERKDQDGCCPTPS
jgi:hypothetical protein